MCLITAGMSQDCEYAVGGLTNIYLANWEEVSGVTQDVNGQITGVTMSGGAKFYEYEFIKNTGTASEELVVGDVNRYFTQSVGFSVNKKTQAKNTQFELMGLSKLTAIIKTKAGNAFLYGWTNPIEPSALQALVGGGPDDTNGYVVTLAGEQTQLADTVDVTIIAGLL